MRLEDALPAIAANRLSEQVYDHLKTAILNGRFEPGQRLVPEELATHFQVSLTPVRDALKQLESDGLVTILARRGVFITEVSARDVREIFQIRQIIERAALEQVDSLPDATLGRLQAIVAEMEALKEDDHYQDYPRHAQLDAAFHQQIVEILGNDQLSRLYEGLRWPIQLVLLLSQSQYQRATQTLAEHVAIVEAIAEKDAVKAQAAITVHLQNALERLLQLLAAKE